MSGTHVFLRALAITLALTPMIESASLQAGPRGLVRSADFSQIYWVDRFGVSHHVPDTGMIPVYFKSDYIKEISWDDWLMIRKGGPITAGTPPEYYDTLSTRITLRAQEIPQPPSSSTRTVYRRIPTVPRAAPIVETKTVTTYSSRPASTVVETFETSTPTDDNQILGYSR